MNLQSSPVVVMTVNQAQMGQPHDRHKAETNFLQSEAREYCMPKLGDIRKLAELDWSAPAAWSYA